MVAPIDVVESRRARAREGKLDAALAASIVEVAPVVIVVLDPEGRIDYANPYFEALTGRRLEDFQGRDWFETFLPERDRARIRELFRTATEGVPVGRNVNAILTSSGEERMIEWHGRGHRDANGALSSLVFVGTDVTDALRAARGHRETEKKLASVFDNTFDAQALIAVDPISGALRVAAVNRRYVEDARACGVDISTESVVGMTREELFALAGVAGDEAAAELERGRYREAIEGGHPVHYPQSFRFGGAQFHTEVSIAPIHDEAGVCTHVVWTSRDVTERVGVEARLRASEARLREAQQIAKVGSWELDHRTRTLTWSDEVFEIFELDRERFAASYEAFLASIPADERPIVDATFQRSLATKEPYEVVHRILTPFGHIKHVRERGLSFYGSEGEPLRSVGTVQDISSQIRAERHLRDILDGIYAFVGLFDLEGVVVEANRAPIEAAGLTRDEVIGRPFCEAYWWSHADETREKIRSALGRAARGEVVRDDLVARMGDDRFITIDAMFGPLADESGRIYGVVGSGVDITERKGFEQRVSAQLAEKEVLLREIHHRVKNNLQVVSSVLFLQQQAVSDDRVAGMFREIRARVAAMGLVHEKLYAPKGDLSRVDMTDYARDLSASLMSTYAVDRSQVALVVRGEPFVTGLDDAIPCGLILNELVSNALKHAFPAGRKGTLTIDVATMGDSFVVTVADDGVGMADEASGAGRAALGLRLIERLAGQLGGVIERSGPPGTTFRLVAPRDRRAPRGSTAPRRT